MPIAYWKSRHANVVARGSPNGVGTGWEVRAAAARRELRPQACEELRGALADWSQVKFKRSGLCFVVWRENGSVAVNGGTLASVSCDPSMFTLLDATSSWKSFQELRSLSHLSGRALRELLRLLLESRMVITSEMEEGSDTRPFWGAEGWEPILAAAKRLSNESSTAPRHRSGEKAPSAFKTSGQEGGIQLRRDDTGTDDTFDSVLELRRSVRAFSLEALDLDEVGRLLYSSCRVMRILDSAEMGTCSFRPYPSAGARHPLEVYIICNRVVGLERGAYYYDPLAHALIPVSTNSAYQEDFNLQVQGATGSDAYGEAPMVLLITAVFERTLWKYPTYGLSLIYKDVGCLYQTIYLVATAIGLGACAIGGGREDLVNDWLGLEMATESQVGWVMVGRAAKPVGDTRVLT